MQVIFIRHAEAQPEGPEGDSARRLSPQGLHQVQAVADALGAMGVKPEMILTSPLARAVQTAEALAASNVGATLELAEMLSPPADASGLRSRLGQLLAAGSNTVCVVGHGPSIDECIGLIAAGRPQIGISLQKAGAACVELPSKWPDAMPELRWIMRREQLELIAGAAVKPSLGRTGKKKRS